MRNPLSRQVMELEPSGIRRFFDVASTMEDVISLGVGEPDFDTPWHIREEGIYSLEKGKTYYTANAGLLSLRKEISRYLGERYQLPYGAEEILVTVGGSEAIDVVFRTMLDPGDEVIIPEPCFVSYLPCVKLAGGVPVQIALEEKDQFKLTGKKLREAITERTKLVVLPFPNNPTGAVMTAEELQVVADIVKEHDLFVMSDEIYSELSYHGSHVSIASIPGMAERTVVINGFSKSFAMTGWRLGYAAGPQEIIQQMTKIHQYIIMSSPTTSQYAAIEALKNGLEDVERMRESYNQRRRFVVKELNDMGMPCFEPYGAFYVFPNITRFGMTSNEFATRLLAEQRVAVVPGDAFGACGEGFLRISYAYSMEDLKRALEKIEKFIDTSCEICYNNA